MRHAVSLIPQHPILRQLICEVSAPAAMTRVSPVITTRGVASKPNHSGLPIVAVATVSYWTIPLNVRTEENAPKVIAFKLVADAGVPAALAHVHVCRE